jgi:hypothetical protein
MYWSMKPELRGFAPSRENGILPEALTGAKERISANSHYPSPPCSMPAYSAAPPKRSRALTHGLAPPGDGRRGLAVTCGSIPLRLQQISFSPASPAS